MFTLKLFGGVALTALDGVVSGRAAQKRRLALLARLALAPERTLSRDKLIGLLWPDTDADRARHLLSVSLHELRRTLGEEIIIGRADDLTLNPSVLTTDVEQFEAALRQDQLETAVGLYAGPFMDGFFSSDGPDLEYWIDSERSRLGRAFATALERCAGQRQAKGDLTGAVEYWRKLAALDPYNARVAREVMLALDAAGDRAGALQHARVHTIMLQEEFGAEPDAEIVQLAERLRAAPIAPKTSVVVAKPAVPVKTDAVEIQPAAEVVSPAPVRAPARTGERVASNGRSPLQRFQRVARRNPLLLALSSVVATVGIARLIWVLQAPPVMAEVQQASVTVMPFVARVPSDTVEYFGYGLSEEISNSLSKLERLFVPSFTSAYLLRDSVDVQEVARRMRTRYVLEGSVNRAGGRLLVKATLIDPITRGQIWTEEYDEVWDATNLVIILNRIAEAVVGKLAISLGQDTTRKLIKEGTRNRQALEWYWKARPYYFDRRYTSLDTALQYMKRAVDADPNYALALAGIADAYIILGAYDYGIMEPRVAYRAARDAAERAMRLDSTLAEPHAVLATIEHNYNYNWKEAERGFKRALALNPGYAQTYHWYSLFLVTQGHPDQARAAITRARELDPESRVVATSFARQLYLNREFDESVRAYREVLKRDPAYVTAHAGIGLAFVALQQYDSALVHYATLSRAMGGPTPLVRGLIAHAAGLAGRRNEALAQLRELNQSLARGYVPHEYLVLANIGVGDKAAAIRSLEQAFDARSGGIAYIGIEPAVDPLRGERAFQALLRKANLVEASAGRR